MRFWRDGTAPSCSLPGAGKSLIYQMAGMCKPGRTIVVDPLIALIEDQQRGLIENGIDRVVGFSRFLVQQGQLDALLKQSSVWRRSIHLRSPRTLPATRLQKLHKDHCSSHLDQFSSDRRSALRVRVGARLPHLVSNARPSPERGLQEDQSGVLSSTTGTNGYSFEGGAKGRSCATGNFHTNLHALSSGRASFDRPELEDEPHVQADSSAKTRRY